MRFKKEEPWKKVFGPYLVHLNSLPNKGDPRTLWHKAKAQVIPMQPCSIFHIPCKLFALVVFLIVLLYQMLKEVGKWPYDFPQSIDFPKANQRGSVSGRLLVKDRYFLESVY